MAFPWKKTDEDGFEQQWQVNALGHFLFCRVLLPAISKASSGAHRLHPGPIDYDLLTMEHASDKNFDQ
jgi:NAD(P)-dependent dehydrogenase (short-subunit alcohol dehydrogenase family)